jgi:hypothetical protein
MKFPKEEFSFAYSEWEGSGLVVTHRGIVMRLALIDENLYVMLCSDLLKFLCDRGECFRFQAFDERRIAAQDIDKSSIRCIIGLAASLERCPKKDYTLDITLPISHEDIPILRFDSRIFASLKRKIKGLPTSQQTFSHEIGKWD